MTPEELKNFRLGQNWSQPQMAKAFGIHQSQISRWEKNKSPIPKWVHILKDCLEKEIKFQ
ncbi:unnamed protein product [marine sediment metagenome]|uniref:HTH cro/C1-type domain-containing protein n=1 Tax=marine sediment metagenome TaxID=412755 RepID=X1D239_9ZZZZ